MSVIDGICIYVQDCYKTHHKAGQIELAVYRHRPHGFSDFLQNFQISDAIQ